MLNKGHRLRLERDFKRTFEQGKGAASAFFVIKWLNRAKNDVVDDKLPGAGPSRFGFVVGKKVARSSVGRHRLKRQMREIVHLMLNNGLIKPNFDVVVVAKPEAAVVENAVLAGDFEKLFGKARIC